MSYSCRNQWEMSVGLRSQSSNRKGTAVMTYGAWLRDVSRRYITASKALAVSILHSPVQSPRRPEPRLQWASGTRIPLWRGNQQASCGAAGSGRNVFTRYTTAEIPANRPCGSKDETSDSTPRKLRYCRKDTVARLTHRCWVTDHTVQCGTCVCTVNCA